MPGETRSVGDRPRLDSVRSPCERLREVVEVGLPLRLHGRVALLRLLRPLLPPGVVQDLAPPRQAQRYLLDLSISFRTVVV